MFTIWACGSNGSFQLGLGNDADQNRLQPVRGLPPLRPKKLAFGGNHTFILYPDLTLYAAGANHHGQCGVPHAAVLEQFTRVPGKWSDVAAGWEFSVFHAHSTSETHVPNGLYVAGNGPKGELGLGPTTSAPSLAVLDFPKTDIAALCCSINHTVVRLPDGTVWGWGASRKGQLGPLPPATTASGKSKPCAAVTTPRRLPFVAQAGICVGKDRTVVWGDTVEVVGADPVRLAARPEKVAAMWTSVHCFQKQRLTSVGNNSHGQLFTYASPAIVDFAVGSEHGLVLLPDNTVRAWGWGEHGNCGENRSGGEPGSRSAVTFDYLNTIYSGADPVVGVAGGLATSWVVTECDTASSPYSSMR